MTDIVERLRATDGTYAITTIIDRCTEAADEIERLRIENNELLEALADLLWEASDKSEENRLVTRIRATALIARIKGDDFKLPDGTLGEAKDE